MSPRQKIRAWEVRAPETPATLGQQTDRQVRQYPDASGAEPYGATLDQHLDIVASRMRLNAGSLDWRQGPSGGSGGGGIVDMVHEAPEGDRDGTNTVYTTSNPFVPQTLQFFVNGLRQMLDAAGNADFTISESAGVGTGYDTLTLAWAALPQDQLLVDYMPSPAGD